MVGEEDARKFLHDLVATPSPSGSEQRVAEIARDWMLRNGYSAAIDAAGNVVGTRGPAVGPTIVLLGHIDTIPTLLSTIVVNDILYGRGSVDAKGPFATFAVAVANLKSPRARYIVIGAVDEETSGSWGAKYICSHYSPNAVIIGEPSGYDAIAIGYKGRLAVTYSVACKAVHSAVEADNACGIAMEFWQQLRLLTDRWPSHEICRSRAFWRVQLHCDSLHGDAERAELRFALRVPPDFPADEFLLELSKLARVGSLRVDEVTKAALFSRNSPAARALSRSIREAGLQPRIKVKTGTCDMNVVSSVWPTQMIAYGPGDSRLDHTAEEHIRIPEYFAAIKILENALFYLESELLAARCQPTAETFAS